MCNPVDRDRFADSSPPPGVPVWVDRRWACAHPSRRIGAAFSCHAFGCAGVRCAGDPRVRRGSRAARPAGVGWSIGRRGCDQSAQLGELAFAVVSGGQARLVWSCPPQGQGGQDGQCEEGDPSGHDRQSRGHGTQCTSAHTAYLDVPHYLDNTAPTPVDVRVGPRPGAGQLRQQVRATRPRQGDLRSRKPVSPQREHTARRRRPGLGRRGRSQTPQPR